MTDDQAAPLQPRAGSVNPNALVVVLAFSGIAVSLMQTLVIPLIAELPRLLGASIADTSWVITATLLASAVSIPIAGRLGDMYGKRHLLLVSLGLLVVGSVVCGLSDSLVPMILGRVLQGMAAGVIPLGISLMRDQLPAERLGSATALMSASLGVGGALGLPAAAILAESTDWHVLFWTSAALGVVAVGLVLRFVLPSAEPPGGRFDLVGAAGLSTVLVCVLLAISKGADWGWTSWITGGLFLGAIGVALLWGWWELRVEQPLVDLRTTARHQVLLTNLASIAFGFAMFAMSLVVPQVVQLPVASGHGFGQSMVVVGLVMAPSGLVMMAMAPVSARISRKRGPKATLMLGAVVVAVGYGLGIVLMSALWQLVLVTAVIGCGIGLAYGAMPTLVMASVPVSETAAANSLNTLMRSIGTSTASALSGAILAQLTMRLGTTTIPSAAGFRTVLAVAVGAALIALLLAALLRGGRPQPTSLDIPARRSVAADRAGRD